MSLAATNLPAEHLCPKHPDAILWGVLAGGSGFCKSCGCYVQAAGVEMPQLDPAFIEKREAALAVDRKTKRNAKAKARRISKQLGSIKTAAHQLR